MRLDFRTRSAGASPLPTWRTAAAPVQAYWTHLATDGAGRWVALGYGASNTGSSFVALSEDGGDTWELVAILAAAGGSVTRLVCNNGVFVAVGTQSVWSSPGGRIWTDQTAGLPYPPNSATGFFTALAFGGSVWIPHRMHMLTGSGAGPWTATALPQAANWRAMAGLESGLVCLFDVGSAGRSRAYRRASAATFTTGDLLPGAASRVVTGFARSLDGWPGWFFAVPNAQAAIWRSAQADVWDALPLPFALTAPAVVYGDGGLLIAGRSDRCLRSATGAEFSEYSRLPFPYFVNDMAASGRRYGAVGYLPGTDNQFKADKFLFLDIPA